MEKVRLPTGHIQSPLIIIQAVWFQMWAREKMALLVRLKTGLNYLASFLSGPIKNRTIIQFLVIQYGYQRTIWLVYCQTITLIIHPNLIHIPLPAYCNRNPTSPLCNSRTPCYMHRNNWHAYSLLLTPYSLALCTTLPVPCYDKYPHIPTVHPFIVHFITNFWLQLFIFRILTPNLKYHPPWKHLLVSFALLQLWHYLTFTPSGHKP